MTFGTNVVLRIINRTTKSITGKYLKKNKFSLLLCDYIEKIVRKILQNVLKYLIINRKFCMDVVDLINSHDQNFHIFLKNLNRKLQKTYKDHSDLSSRKPLPVNLNFDSFSILKYWDILNFNNTDNGYKKQMFPDTKKEIVIYSSLHLKSILFKDYIYYKFIIKKLEKGSLVEKEFCFEIISNYKRINFISSYILLYIDVLILDSNATILKIKLALKLISSIIINKMFDPNSAIKTILPIIIRIFERKYNYISEKNKVKMKINILKIFNLLVSRLTNERFKVRSKILSMIQLRFLDSYKRVAEILKNILFLSILGSKSVEFFLMPYIRKVIKTITTEIEKKNLKLKELKFLCNFLVFTLISFYIKKYAEIRWKKIKKRTMLQINIKTLIYLIHNLKNIQNNIVRKLRKKKRIAQ